MSGLPLYYQALTPKLELTSNDRLILEFIEAHGPVTRARSPLV
jgi:hypothetical protein